MSAAILDQALRVPPSSLSRDETLDNLAVVRMWWTVLAGECRGALADRDGRSDLSIVEPCLRAALASFESFEAGVDDLLAAGEQVIASVSLRGRLRGAELELREAWLCRVSEGTVTSVEAFASVEQAISALAA